MILGVAARRARTILGAALVSAFAAGASAQEFSDLLDTCFTRTYDAVHMFEHPGQRVTDIAVHFQGFEDSLLASVSYTLRFGIRFGFSGDCHDKIEGGFLCHACANDICDGSGETFKILPGSDDTIRLINDTTGVVGENSDGGRDYLKAGGEHGVFVLRKASPENCTW
jgi:hypothetical protein